MLIVLDKLIDDEMEAGWERAQEISAFDNIEEYRNHQHVSSNVVNAARALVGALIVQHRIERMSSVA